MAVKCLGFFRPRNLAGTIVCSARASSAGLLPLYKEVHANVSQCPVHAAVQAYRLVGVPLGVPVSMTTSFALSFLAMPLRSGIRPTSLLLILHLQTCGFAFSALPHHLHQLLNIR